MCLYLPIAFGATRPRRKRWAEHVEHTGEIVNVYKTIVGNVIGEKPLQRPRRRCRDIKIYLKVIMLIYVVWIQLAEDMVQSLSLLNTVINFQIVQRK
jgi:hypothetical protein